MKSIPSNSKRKVTLEEAEALARRDKRKLIVMGVGLVMLIGAFIFGQFYRGQSATQADADAPPLSKNEEPQAQVFFPERPHDEVLARIKDATPDQRVVIDGESLQAVLTYSALMTKQHYAELDIAELDEARLARLTKDSNAQRMDALRGRGTLLTLRKRQRAESTYPEYYGTLALENGAHAHYVVVKPPSEDKLAEGSFVRLDGMFFKNYSVEVGDRWIDGPLVLGRELVRSFPSAVAGANMPRLAEVADDTMEGASGLPEDAKWELMAHAKLDADEVDWEKTPKLSKEMLNQIFQDGAMHRGQPFILPISTNMGSQIVTVGENPLRLERVTEGWIGNYVWSGNVGLIKYVAPFEVEGIEDRKGVARLVSGRGYFLKNLNYEDSKGRPGRVPFFVIESLDLHTPETDGTPTMIMWILFGGLGVFIVLVTWLLARDKREAAKLQGELLRRRRARREKSEPLTPQES